MRGASMLELVQHRVSSPDRASPAPAVGALVAGWREGLTIVNVRGDAQDTAFSRGVERTLGLALPTKPGAMSEDGAGRIVWAGPDDWFVMSRGREATTLVAHLRESFAGLHHAVTDVSSGYSVLHLSGPCARDVIAQGCPLDLHPREFRRGSCAGSHFFKAHVWLWQTDDSPAFELLVRRSFMGYVWLMLERGSAECGLVTRRIE